MPLVSSTIPNLINGVSQQPYILRLSSQGEIQDNGYATVAEGLKKRPPSMHIAKLFNSGLANAFIHVINRDENEKYIVTIINGDLKVHTVGGVERTVNFPNGKTYLLSNNPVSTFRAVTIADYTFFLNNDVTVKPGTLQSATRPHEALVYIKQGNYGRTYKIIINGAVVAQYTTPNGGDPSHANYIDTSYIASQLIGGLNSNLVGQNFGIAQYGSSIHISHAFNNFSIAVDDGFNGNASELIKQTTQRFSDLPGNAPDGYIVEVVGDAASSFDNYYVKFEKENPSDSTGVWRETVKPGIALNLNNATMPHILVREANGTFTFKQADWGKRIAGDEKSSPYPSFLNYKLSDLFFYRNRLGVLCEENVIFSEAGEFFNFFPTTVTTLLDSDPIDVAVSHVKVSTLRFAVPFNEELLLFSAQTQFTMTSGDLLTPKSVQINQTTEFECSTKVRPVCAGQNVFFAVSKGAYTGVREFFVDADSTTNDAADITAHVSKYIVGKPVKMAAAPNEDTVVVLADGQRNVLYIYKYYWSGEDKLQSSWSRWVFSEDATVLTFEFIETKLYMVVARPDGTYLEVVNMELGADDGVSSPYRLMLDRKVVVPAGDLVDFGGFPYTQVPLPYQIHKGDYVAFVNGGTESGAIREIEVRDGQYYIPGDFRLNTLVCGVKYPFKYRFSTPMIKEQAAGGGTQSVITGRLQLRRFAVAYEETGHFRAEVTPKGRSPFVYTFTGRVVGDLDTPIGSPALATGIYRFPVMGRNTDVTIDIINDTPYPNSLLNATWEGYFVNHTRRI